MGKTVWFWLLSQLILSLFTGTPNRHGENYRRRNRRSFGPQVKVSSLSLPSPRSRSFLVFEATGQVSLKQHLNDPLKTPLNWKTRLQIALGVAAALEYLPLFCDPPVYHVSISSSDILLDDKFTAKLSDISLLCPVSYPSNLPSSNSEGSVQPGKNLIPKFGALLLELITGHWPVIRQGKWGHDRVGPRIALEHFYA